MKKFLFLSLVFAALAIKGSACAWEGPTYNYYMFHVFKDGSINAAADMSTDDFWRKYMNKGSDEYYHYYGDEILEAAKQRGDNEMVGYVERLNNYLNICDQLRETWTYPTKEELRQRTLQLNEMVKTGTAYKGSRLRQQYALLAMRANMVLKNHQANADYWTATASKFSNGPYKERMRNIYANALLNLGKMQQAWDIYAEQGDLESLQWSVHKMRDVAGISDVYKKNPNAQVLKYLVEQFVNDRQETLDWGHEVDPEWIEEIGSRLVDDKETAIFLQLADEAAANPKSEWPCMWRTAAGMLRILQGDNERAMRDLKEAQTMKGTPRMLDNARCISLLAYTRCAPLDQRFTDHLMSELNWLNSKITPNDYEDTYYEDAKARILHQELYNRLEKSGNHYAALALLSMIYEDEFINQPDNTDNYRSPNYVPSENTYNNDYCTDFGAAIDTLSANEIIDLYKYLNQKHDNALENLLVSRAYRSADYFNDLIGTHLMAENRFEEALPYLKKVPLKFLETMNISWYLANRDYKRPRWLGRQIPPEDKYIDGPLLGGHFTTNMKLDFCQDILQMQAQYRLTKPGEQKCALAYKLATAYYQASHLGDCWFLTHYGGSYYYELHPSDVDLADIAIEYLKECKKTKDSKLKQDALYALAFIPKDQWADYEWWEEKWKFNENSRQFQAMKELNDYTKANSAKLSPYVTKCDMLKLFRKYSSGQLK